MLLAGYSGDTCAELIKAARDFRRPREIPRDSSPRNPSRDELVRWNRVIVSTMYFVCTLAINVLPAVH